MAIVKIYEELCKSCRLCVEACPRGALAIARHLNVHGFYPVVFDDSKECSGCCNCTVMCPDAAIELRAEAKAERAAV
ncbi:MAG: 4Fe-4S binding protein [Planctomycetes bacterium]|jgi:2-oxoglutarate ferredoxin oxidoreductase subunit delta|nr:4Fe-4S binding protein [Planctomycetota bacterium]